MNAFIKWIFGIDDFPQAEEAENAVRTAEMPWISEEAFAAFAKFPEVQGAEAHERQIA